MKRLSRSCRQQQQKGRRKGESKRRNARPRREGWTNQNVYIFYEDDVFKPELHVFAVNSTTSLSAVTKFHLNHSYDMGYVALDSKLYAIGGARRRSDCGYSRNVFICDLIKKNKVGGGHKWKKGASLTAIKPNPMVVAVEGKIYALAGHANANSYGPGGSPRTIEPVFEVYEPTEDAWYALPNPPFLSFYSTSPGPRLVSHTVIDNTIYVLVENPTERAEEEWEPLYAYNVTERERKYHKRGAPAVPGNPIGGIIESHFWNGRADVVDDDKMYSCDATASECLQVFAHHLTAEREKVVENMQLKGNKTSIHDDGNSLYWDVISDPSRHGWYGIPFIKIPVKLLLTSGSSCLVAHLGNQMLLVVCAYDPPAGVSSWSAPSLRMLAKAHDGSCCDRETGLLQNQPRYSFSIRAWSTMNSSIY